MKFVQISLIVLVSAGLISLGACSSNPTAKTENTSKAESTTKTEEKGAAGDTHKSGGKHVAGDTHKESKGGHSGQTVQVGKYHVEFKPDPDKEAIHLDTILHGEQDKQITDAKLIAQVQLPDGSNKTLPVPYNAEEKQYTTSLPMAGAGDYKVVMQADINGEKFNSRFSFKK
jgi:hypothetical protein